VSSTKKIWLIILVSLLILGSLVVFWRMMLITNHLRSTDPVSYDKSYGTVCPVDVQFLESKTSPTVECECPDGYSQDRTMIGSTTGKACYGAGTECPIFAVSCVLTGN
jgi:hypothetical protein